MKIQELAPMSVEEYVAHFVSVLPAIAQPYPDPFQLFAPSIEAVKKTAFAPYFWFIADYTTMTVADVDAGVEQHVQHRREEWLANGPAVTAQMIHPDDVSIKTAYNYFQETYLGRVAPDERKHLKFNTFFRVLDRQKVYRWYTVQMPDYYYDDGNIVFGLHVAYDISHLKKDGLPMMTLLNDRDPHNQVFLCHSNNGHKALIDKLLQITNREMQVIRLLAAGQLSKEIADQLGISPSTVENHKQNVFRKTSTRSASELVAFAIRSGIA